MEQMIREKLHKLIDAFTPILYEDDETFLRNMKDRNLAGDDIRRYQSATSFGARINLEYPQLARERQYSMLIAITNPNGDVIVDKVSEDILYRGHYMYYWNFYTFDEYFDIMSDAYGTVPTGTYTWSLYYDGRFVTSDTFRITY